MSKLFTLFAASTRVAALALFVLSLSGMPNRALACTTPPVPPPDIWLFHSSAVHASNEVWVIFHNYSTFGSSPGQFCACGLVNASAIASVDGAEIVLAGTDTPVEGFSFTANATTGADLTAAAGISISGFSSAISAAVSAGVPVDLRFAVTLAHGSSVNDLSAQLGAGIVVGTDEAAANGSLLNTHQELRVAGAIMIDQAAPSMTLWGLVATSAAMLAMIGIARSRRQDGTRRRTSMELA